MQTTAMNTCTIPLKVTGRDIQEMEFQRYPEVLFSTFTQQQPWNEEANFADAQEETIPIFKLSHITHNIEAASIQGKHSFTFIPKMKLGKAYEEDGSPLGETYKEVAENEYQNVPRSIDNPVFPGYWSWWGIDTRDWMCSSSANSLAIKIYKNSTSGSYAPGYLSTPVGSSYGNNAFGIKLKDILADYEWSRPDEVGKEKVCLKMGGTLRYRHEICYVVMVCMEGDLQDTPKVTGPTLPFDPRGLVDDCGIVVDYSATPSFTIQSIVKNVKINIDGACEYDNYDWEQLVFGFYFPEQDQTLVCANVDVTSVKHDRPKCTSTYYTQAGWLCPNKLYQPKMSP